MNKQAIFILGLFTLFFSTAYVTTKLGIGEPQNVMTNESVVSAFKENAIVNEENVISVTAEEEKTTPNTELILKKYYKDCGHTIVDKAEIPGEMVNLTKEELASRYASWVISDFSKDEVVLFRELESFCGEHYLMIEEDGIVSIYTLDEAENRTLIETTEIAVEYLPETDKIILKNGIYIYGNEELNKIREDFES